MQAENFGDMPGREFFGTAGGADPADLRHRQPETENGVREMRVGKKNTELSFYRRRRQINLTMVKNAVFWVIEAVIVSFIAFLLVYCFGIRVTVSGNSMNSTLEDGDTVLVNRLTYLFNDPEANDVIAFYPNGNEKSNYYVKRVVAVPGDTVQIIDGVLYVNGETFDQEDTDPIEVAGEAEEEITLGEDEYFVLGDDRNSSEDSRYANLGNVDREDIVGKVWLRVRPLSSLGRVE